MPYVDFDIKARLTPAIRAVCKRYRVKSSVRVNGHHTLEVELSCGPVQFGEPVDYARWQISEIDFANTAQYNSEALNMITELSKAMKTSDWVDPSTEYTETNCKGYNLSIRVGRDGKPYKCTTLA